MAIRGEGKEMQLNYHETEETNVVIMLSRQDLPDYQIVPNSQGRRFTYESYNEQVRSNWAFIIRQFEVSSDTRRGIILINPTPIMEHPCCTSLQFIKEDGKLSLIANFRAMHRGFYIHDKTFLAKKLVDMANDVGLPIGRLHVNIGYFW